MSKDVIDALANRFVLFSCEGAAEGVVIQTLFDNDRLAVPRDLVVRDNTYFNRPYTRLRKANQIAEEYFGMSYESPDASGLTIARIVDSKSPKFEFSKRCQNGTQVVSFYTRPEIEMLVIHSEGAFGDWQKASRRQRQLKPNEFCKQSLGISRVKETAFLKDYWADADRLISAIMSYAEHSHCEPSEFTLRDLID